MVKSYAIIENGKVVNRILATEDFMAKYGKEYVEDNSAQIGAIRQNGEFVMPEPAEMKKPEADPLLTKLVEKGVLTELEAASIQGAA